MDIKCKKCECKYNKSCCCTAYKIKVGSKVDCETYEYSERNAENLKQSAQENMFEISEPLNSRYTNRNIKIYCDAKCLFNYDGVCRANGITVLENDSSKKIPCCVTQIDK